MNFDDPFKKTLEELTDENMNKNTVFESSTILSRVNPLLPADSAYDFISDEVERALENEKGASVNEFFDRLNMFNLPKFSNLDNPQTALHQMNVREIEDSFKTRSDLETHANFLFNPQEGNTPEERAKSENINKIIAEIDNFQKQYKLTDRQAEQLKSQVLANHLGEYITDVRNIRQSDLEREKASLISNAKSDGDNRIRDPIGGVTEDNINNDADAIETIGEEEPLDFDATPRTSGGAASGAGADPDATSVISDTSRQRQDALRLLNVLRNGQGDNFKKLRTIFRNNSAENIKTHIKISPPKSERNKNIRRLLMNFFKQNLSLGDKLSEDEINYIKDVIDEMDEMIIKK